jgi:cephalosporin-C deacetylase
VPLYDLNPDQLARYTASTPPPADLDDFWQTTLTQSRAVAAPPSLTAVDCGLSLVEAFDVRFSGYAGDPVHAWLHRPAGTDAVLPAIVRYLGYGAGRGLPHEVDTWTLAGYATLIVDTRGQGSGHTPGDTPDPFGSGPAQPGYLTRGILDPREYYYRRVFTDAALAVDAARQLPGIDPARVAVTGGSQGGGLSLAVSALVPDVLAAMPDVPFLCDFRRATEITASDPYAEIVRYLRVHRGAASLDQVFRTLSYFDCAILARSATAPALFSVALMDPICPPSTVYAAYNAYAGPKDIRVYPFNEHEGGQGHHQAEQLRWLYRLLH